MADAPSTTAPVTEPAATADPPVTDPPADLGDAGKKALEAERREKRAAEKRANDLAARLKEFEDRDKSEAQRLADALAEAQTTAQKAQADALRFRIAAKYQVSDDDAELFLTGADEETLTRQAERLTARATQATETAIAATAPGPRPDLSQGARATDPALNSDAITDSLKQVLGIR